MQISQQSAQRECRGVLSVIRLGLKSFRVLEIICHYGTIITKHSSGSKSAQRGDGSNRDG